MCCSGSGSELLFVDEHIDQRALRERASTAIVTVIVGQLSARKIEMEFHNILSGEHTWRWSAKKYLRINMS
jgi:hypothetical protein